MGQHRPPPIRAEREEIEAMVRAALGPDELERLWAEGTAASLDDVVEPALAFTERVVRERGGR